MHIRKRLTAVAAVAAGLLAFVAMPQASAADSPIPGIQLQLYTGPAADPDHPAYQIRSGWTDRCLEPELAKLFVNGAATHLDDCAGAAAQAFYVTKNPEGFYRFQNIVDKHYLEASLDTIGANGTKVQLWEFVAGGRNQWWQASVNEQGFLRLKNTASGRYLEASKSVPGGGANNTKVQLWDFVAGGTNQWWH